MSKRLILILALAFVVGITFAAYAEVQNVKVSGDIKATGVVRSNLTLKDNEGIADFGESISAILSQARVRVDADLTDNVSTTVRLLNERVWGDEIDNDAVTANVTSKTNNTEIDLDLAYVTLKEFLYSPLTLTVGRQELRFGNALIIGDPDTNSVAAGHGTVNRYLPNSLDDLSLRKSFDAIRANLNYDPLVIDLVYSKIDENRVGQADDTDLYGANAAYAVNKNLNTEVYLWQRTRKAIANTTVALGGTLGDKERLRTAGARGVYAGIKNMFLGLEGAFQFGDHIASTTLNPDEGQNTLVHRKVTAYAIQTGAHYMMPKVKYTPTLGFSYTYLSGDPYLSTSDNHRGWDPMFSDQSRGIVSKISAASNAQIFNINGSLKPADDLTAKLNYTYIMLNQPYTRAATTTAVTLSGVLSDPTYFMKEGKKCFGSEVDLDLTYDYTEDVQFGLTGGAFIPGTAFDTRNKKTASQVIGSMKVTF